MANDKVTETTVLISHRAEIKKNLNFPLNVVPSCTIPYLELIRIEKPTGVVLMFWPFAWGLTMAASTIKLPFYVYTTYLMKFMIGAFLLRGSACTINDIFDREMDAGVERTKNRPLPSGRISVIRATFFLIVLYALGAYFYWRMLTGVALYVALFQLLPLFAIYPLLKRVTYWPQAWLGFAMNFGFIAAWVSVTNSLDIKLFAVAIAGCWCWTMLYDTIYACQDIIDDVKMGVRSTAILWGSWIRPLLMACGFGFVAMLAVAGVLTHQGAAYFTISVGGSAAHIVWQFMTVHLDIPASCGRNFKRNGHLGWIVWGGLFVDYMMHAGYVSI